MNVESISSSAKQSSPVWTIFVGFDDTKARTRASEVCELMTAQFWPAMEFDLRLCDLTQLGESSYRQQAISNGAAAHVVIMAASLPATLDFPVAEWMEGVCALRHEREGALVALVDPEAAEAQREATEQHLRQLAHRAGLDFLTHAPDCRSLQIPDEAEWLDQRFKLSSVLEKILAKPTGPAKVAQ